MLGLNKTWPSRGWCLPPSQVSRPRVGFCAGPQLAGSEVQACYCHPGWVLGPRARWWDGEEGASWSRGTQPRGSQPEVAQLGFKLWASLIHSPPDVNLWC